MKGFVRENQLLSLCGLNCGLCPMKLDGYCPGCGGGDGNQSCAIARCSIKRGWSIVFSVSLILVKIIKPLMSMILLLPISIELRILRKPRKWGCLFIGQNSRRRLCC